MKSKSVELSHLTQAAQDVAMLSDEERIRHIRSDRWIAYTRAHKALERLEELLTWPKKQRMPNLLMIGPTNNGKSMCELAKSFAGFLANSLAKLANCFAVIQFADSGFNLPRS